jgi:hypothetical protein
MPLRNPVQHKQKMIDGGMMRVMGFGDLILFILVVLVIVAVVKYIFSR